MKALRVIGWIVLGALGVAGLYLLWQIALIIKSALTGTTGAAGAAAKKIEGAGYDLGMAHPAAAIWLSDWWDGPHWWSSDPGRVEAEAPNPADPSAGPEAHGWEGDPGDVPVEGVTCQ